MKILIKRIYFKDIYTIGKLSIDGIYFCDTLEDKNRDINHDGDLKDLNESKVYGQTAIPFGKYKIAITFSNRFQKELPLIINVPEFEGIRIHGGNTSVDTHGCILVGENKIKGELINSAKTLNALMLKISKVKDIEIEII